MQGKIKTDMNYTAYRELMETLVSQKKSTGTDQSEIRVNFTALNHQRMKRLDKKGEILDVHQETIKGYKNPMKWVVLAESWCGDAAQILPYINKVAQLNDNIVLDVLLRDENLELMDAHLTNGGRAIPKLIAFDAANNVIAKFGPRPNEATQMVVDFKANHGAVTDELKKDLQVWYTKNKGVNIVENLVQAIFEAVAV